jgi:hypothetical protein
LVDFGLVFPFRVLLTFFLDLKADVKRDTPRNDEVFEEEVGETVGKTAAGPWASAVSDLWMRL